MIFVALGTQKFQMNRLIMAIDKQIQDGLIKNEVFAQIGNSDYTPQNFKYKEFLSSAEFIENIEQSEIIITHSGVSTIIKSLLLNKNVIVVPRMAKFNEHVDDHQIEIAENFSKLNYVYMVSDVEKIFKYIDKIKIHKFDKYESGNEKMINTIETFINDWSEK